MYENGNQVGSKNYPDFLEYKDGNGSYNHQWFDSERNQGYNNHGYIGGGYYGGLIYKGKSSFKNSNHGW